MAARIAFTPSSAALNCGASRNSESSLKLPQLPARVNVGRTSLPFARQRCAVLGDGFSSSEFVSGRAWNSAEPRRLGIAGVGNVGVAGSKEKELLDKLRAAVSNLGGNLKDLDDDALLRFLRAQSLKVDKAAEKVVAHLRWKAGTKPRGYVPEAQIREQFAHGKLFLQGHSKQGFPVFVTLGRKHVPADSEQFKRFVTFALDKTLAGAPPGQPQIVGIVDLKGLGFGNLDANGYIAAFLILQDQYPGNLHKMFMVNVPFIFNGVWKMVSPFLDEQTRSKVIFVSDNKLKETLLAEIDRDQLPVEYGGTAKLVPLKEAVVKGYRT